MTKELRAKAKRWLKDYTERDDGPATTSPYELNDEAAEIIEDFLKEEKPARTA